MESDSLVAIQAINEEATSHAQHNKLIKEIGFKGTISGM